MIAFNYTYYAGNILHTADGATYTHDANGNRTTKTNGANVTNYTYDSLNRLTQVVGGSQTTQYIYNGLGQRVGRIDNGVQTNYLVDPNRILSQALAETDNTNNLITYYVYDGVGPVAKINSSNEYYFYHYDGLGSTIAITNSTGQVVNSYCYSPEGLVGGQETISNAFKYVGRYGVMDEGNGLYYMRARYYDPETGRFINKDPIGFLGGLNMYAYVGNNPINWIDPWGLKKWIFISASGGANLGPIPFGGEAGTYYLVDPCTGEYHQWVYFSFGPGFGFGAAGQLEGGRYEGPEDPTQISSWSLTVSAFAAASRGVSGQITGTSFWGEGEWGYTVGHASGGGAGISGMVTWSPIYVGKGNIKKESQKIYDLFKKLIENKQ